MVAVHPVLVTVGEVRDVRAKTWLNPESGEVEARGRTVLVLTGKGFVSMTVPREFGREVFEVGDTVGAWTRVAEWSMNGRSGVSFFFEGRLPADATAALLDLAPAPVGV